jgi:hypothetical protein
MAKPVVEKGGLLEQVLSKLNPMEAAVMILGGTAASCGIVPPMTQLLRSFSGNLTIFDPSATVLTGPPTAIGWLYILQHPDEFGNAKPTTAEDVKALGLFCAGAIEAMIMYNLVKNPELTKTLIDIPFKILHATAEGIDAIVPG